MKKVWEFTVDGQDGRAERYGVGRLQVFVFWAGIGCHLEGLIKDIQDAVLDAEK